MLETPQVSSGTKLTQTLFRSVSENPRSEADNQQATCESRESSETIRGTLNYSEKI